MLRNKAGTTPPLHQVTLFGRFQLWQLNKRNNLEAQELAEKKGSCLSLQVA